MRMSLMAMLLGILLVLAGCLPVEGDVCEPGRAENCTCPSGGEGSQTCDEDGSGWGECECDDSDDDDTAPSCGDLGGYWADDGIGGMGCWFAGGIGESCDTACASHGLQCDGNDWNDSEDSDICTYLTAAPQSTSNNPDPKTYSPALYLPTGTSHGCYYRHQVGQDCARTPGGMDGSDATDYRRICVCEL